MVRQEEGAGPRRRPAPLPSSMHWALAVCSPRWGSPCPRWGKPLAGHRGSEPTGAVGGTAAISGSAPLPRAVGVVREQVRLRKIPFPAITAEGGRVEASLVVLLGPRAVMFLQGKVLFARVVSLWASWLCGRDRVR